MEQVCSFTYAFTLGKDVSIDIMIRVLLGIIFMVTCICPDYILLCLLQKAVKSRNSYEGVEGFTLVRSPYKFKNNRIKIR